MRLTLGYVNQQHMEQGQTTTPGTLCPNLCDKGVGSLTSPVNHCELLGIPTHNPVLED